MVHRWYQPNHNTQVECECTWNRDHVFNPNTIDAFVLEMKAIRDRENHNGCPDRNQDQ
jgi:hypothetical protein